MQQIIHIITEFASQSTEFASSIPTGFIDKTVCGCGLSTVAIESTDNVILAVPRKNLIANKLAQYPNKRCSYHLLGVDGDKDSADLNEYVQEQSEANLPCKILVTYDSLWKVSHLLLDPAFSSSPFKLVIDESQRVLKDASMKSNSKTTDVDVACQVLDIAKSFSGRVSFISATPIPLKYLATWIGELPQIKYTWSNTIKSKPYLLKRGYPFQALSKEIIAPLNTNGEIEVSDLKAKKVIVFINSVKQIVKICRENKLSKADVAIVVADSSQNDARIAGYNRLVNPNKLPKFTFITSSGFEGMDLYDDEAISVVVSNTQKSHQMIDLLTDFKQATSRQRVKTNPNYGKFIFIYNQTIFDDDEATLIAHLDKWYKMLERIIVLAKLDKVAMDLALKNNKDVNAYTNIVNDEYVLNDNLFNADRYFILEVMKQYREGFDIRGEVDGYSVKDDEITAIEIPKEVTYADIAKYAKEVLSKKVYAIAEEQWFHYNSIKIETIENDVDFRRQLYLSIEWGVLSTRREWINLVGKTYVGLRKITQDYTAATELIVAQTKGNADTLKVLVGSKFVVGKDYTRADVKKKLSSIYTTLGINRLAKHTDLYEYFECKEKTTRGERQLEVIKRKSN